MAIPIPPQAPMPPGFHGGFPPPQGAIPVDDWRPDLPVAAFRGEMHVDDWRPDPPVRHGQRDRSPSPVLEFFGNDGDDIMPKTKKGKKATKPVEISFEGYMLHKAKPSVDQKSSWSRVGKRDLPFDDKKLLALVKDHRLKTRTGPAADFSQLSSNQQGVVLRLIAQRKEEEQNPNADWVLVDTQKDGIWHFTRPMEVQKIQVILKRQDKSITKPGDRTLSSLPNTYQSYEIIDLSEPLLPKKTGKSKSDGKRAQVDEASDVFNGVIDTGVYLDPRPVNHNQGHGPAHDDRDYQQPQPTFGSNMPDMNPNPMHGHGQTHNQGHDRGQYDHERHQPLPPFDLPQLQAPPPPPLPPHVDEYPLPPHGQQYMPPPIGNPFMPNLDLVPPEQYRQQSAREGNASFFTDSQSPHVQQNMRPGTPRLQRSTSAKRIRQLECDVESLGSKVDQWHLSSDSSTGGSSAFEESFTPPSTPPRSERAPRGILHHRKSIDHSNQSWERRSKDQRVAVKPTHTHQTRPARHSPERRGSSRERPPYSPERPYRSPEQRRYSVERPRDSPERPRYSTERPRYSPERPRYSPERARYQEERPRYREEQRRYRDERPRIQRAATYDDYAVEHRYVPRIQRRLTDYEEAHKVADFDEQYRRQREPLRRWSNDPVQEAYEAGRRVEIGSNRRRSSIMGGDGYYD
ncbi:hypothetical protein LTR08_003614 [Meristemomyces frigidus]|nr:hypothetical protein LTR08_003614 [Meristemomyces frigidus]